jgi:hypothetical protein
VKKNSALFAIGVVLVAASAAQAQNFAVGTCLPNLVHFQKIQDAVSGVTPGSTIFVCPNVYPEQVTISQPLTLQGVAYFGHDRPTITVPPSDPATGAGLQPNFFDPGGNQYAAQVLVKSNPGPVNILNMTIDGSGAPTGCSNSILVQSTYLAGVFFEGSGSIKNSTFRNQEESIPGCGDGIYADSSLLGGSLEISNNSFHNFDGIGIIVSGLGTPAVFTAEILSNSVHGTSNAKVGIYANNVLGDIAHNVVTGGYQGIFANTSTQYGPNVTDNDVADVNTGVVAGGSSTAKANRIAGATTGLLLAPGAVGVAPTVMSNSIKDTNVAIEYDCTTNATVKSNTITDAVVAFDQVPLTRVFLAAVNQLSAIDTFVVLGACQ